MPREMFALDFYLIVKGVVLFIVDNNALALKILFIKL
tara:strand:+ start:5074 stop:5184 length:111 start_codon:yes stop_codon:yes gene_type:complete